MGSATAEPSNGAEMTQAMRVSLDAEVVGDGRQAHREQGDRERGGEHAGQRGQQHPAFVPARLVEARLDAIATRERVGGGHRPRVTTAHARATDHDRPRVRDHARHAFGRRPRERSPGPVARDDRSPAAAPSAARAGTAPARDAGRRARDASTASTSRSRPATSARGWSPPSTPVGPVRPCCCAATWTRCPCPRTPASTMRRRSTGRCTPAGTTPTPPCSPARRRSWPIAATICAGQVVFMFQPGEEGFHGARVMLDEGLLDGRNVTRAFAIHQTPSSPSGIDRHPRRPAAGLGRRVLGDGHRQGRPRVDAAPRRRPHPHRMRDGRRVPDDGHPAHRGVPARGRHRVEDPGRDDQQRHPRTGRS